MNSSSERISRPVHFTLIFISVMFIQGIVKFEMSCRQPRCKTIGKRITGKIDDPSMYTREIDLT